MIILWLMHVHLLSTHLLFASNAELVLAQNQRVHVVHATLPEVVQ